MVQTRSKRGKNSSKGGAKSRGGKKKAAKNQKKVSSSKKITKERGRGKTSRIKKTYKSTEEKRNEILFSMLKDYKNKETLELEELLMSFAEDDEASEYDNEGVDYQDMAEQLLEHYQNKTFDLSQFVFNKDIFESLFRKMKMGC